MLCTETNEMAQEQFLDELVGFLGDPIFQIPIRTYMDENCLTFDPDVEFTDDHKKVHDGYNELFNLLLKGFCDDAGVSVDEAIKAFDTMCKQDEGLKDFFEVFYDQVMASTDFTMFFAVMAKRNIIIQQQVLVMILAATGSMPASLLLNEGEEDGSKPVDAMVSTAADKQEEELLKQVMKASKDEHQMQWSLEQQEKAQLQRTLELSKAEAEALSQERKHIEEQLEKLTLEASPSALTSVAQVTSVPAITKKESHTKLAKTAATSSPSLSVTSSKPVSSSDAANAWLSSAQEEATKQFAAHAEVAKNLATLSTEEIKQRQNYLMAQRDKLMAMKKAKREDQLSDAVSRNPQRPCSARAATSAMARPAPVSGGDGDRQMAMRRAIAEKLKREVIRK